MIPARLGIMPLFILLYLTLFSEGGSVDKQTTDEMQIYGLVISVD